MTAPAEIGAAGHHSVPAPSCGPAATAANMAVDRGVYRAARHWLLGVNALTLAYVTVPLAAPLLRAGGHAGLARPIYAYHGLFCHQRPERSFAVAGEQMACCQRCAAIYLGFFLAGLLFALLRGRLGPLGWRGVVIASLPMAVDGLGQLAGLWESTWPVRVATGVLFALGAAWLALPHLEIGFADMRAQLEARFARLVAQGRAGPLPGAPPLPPA